MKREKALRWFVFVGLWGLSVSAQDAGIDGSDTEGGVEDGTPEGIQPTTTPDNLGCSISHRSVQNTSITFLVGLASIACFALRRGKRKHPFLKAGLPLLMALPVSSHAEETSFPSNEMAPISSPEGEMRRIALSWNPFTLHLTRVSLNAELLIASHHGVMITPFYASTTTNTDSFENVFRGWGGEIGYRYYSGKNGARGFFIGPSLLLGFYDAIPKRGDKVPFTNWGGALDVGWQALVADRWVVGLGTGVQYTVPSATFPSQELPASVYASRGLRPRLLLALGVAF